MMEETTKVLICRVCFNHISGTNFLPVKDSLKDMLQIITSELDLDKTPFPLMCSKCYELLQEVFTFKTNCFETEERIESRVSEMNKGDLDLRDIMRINFYRKRQTQKSKRMNANNFTLCRTCLKAVYEDEFIDLNNNIDGKLSALSSCIPEMDLRFTKNPVMCLTCYNSLQKMGSFKSMCKINENKINTFATIMNIASPHIVNLLEVLQYSEIKLLPNCTSTKNGMCIDRSQTIKYKETIIPNNLHDCSKTVVKIEPNNTEDIRGKDIVDCLEFVLVKMEQSDDRETEEETQKKMKSSTRKGREKFEYKGETKSMTYCSDCNFKTKYRYNLRRHLFVAHKRKDIKIGKKFYQCPHCTFSTKLNIDLTRHILSSHVNTELLLCTKCSYSTNRDSQFIKHILSHVTADNIDEYKFLQLTKKEIVKQKTNIICKKY